MTSSGWMQRNVARANGITYCGAIHSDHVDPHRFGWSAITIGPIEQLEGNALTERQSTMEQTFILIEIPRPVAFVSGSSEHGLGHYLVTDALLNCLTLEEREWFAKSLGFAFKNQKDDFCYVLTDEKRRLVATQAPLTVEHVAELIRAFKAESDAKQAEKARDEAKLFDQRRAAQERLDVAISAWLMLPVQDRENDATVLTNEDAGLLFADNGKWSTCTTVQRVNSIRSIPAVECAIAERDAWFQAQRDAKCKAERAENERRQAAAEKAEVEKRAMVREQISEWLREHGNDNQRERFAAELLPTSEIVALERQRRFGDTHKAYESITSRDFTHEPDCYAYPDVRFHSEEWEGPLSADQWTTLKDLKQSYPEPEYTYEMRAHKATCKGCEMFHWRYGVRVAFVAFGQTIYREFAL